MKRYDHREIEPKWQTKWLESKTYQPDLKGAKKPFYNLWMFPYPSGEGLHVGHAFASTGADIHGRYQRMHGKDVFQPIGYDSFGIHSENYALKVGKHPRLLIKKTTERYGTQLKSLGHGYDWSHSLTTSDPNYYKWTQWIFIQLFKKGLAYRGKSKVNWCPTDKTVLADEQVIAGCCERCGSVVETKELEQWFFKITAYADRLLENLDKIDWSQKVKIAQKNWIGKREGAEINFKVAQAGKKTAIGEDIWVFTTRPDTLFGATFVVLSPDNSLLPQLITDGQQEKVNDYLKKITESSTGPTTEQDKEGVFTGAYAVNPSTGQEVPIWVAAYVVGEYGTGAVMGVPAHDERDFDFAKKHKLPIIEVVLPYSEGKYELPYIGEGKLTHSGDFNDLSSNVAQKKIVDELAKRDDARLKTTYRLRDWLISRQRYWGPPIPMVKCPVHDWVPVSEEDLPVLLPETKEFRPTGEGKTPLGLIDSFIKTKCPVCGEEATRSDEVSDTFLDSAWYFLRYPSIYPEQRRGTPSGQVPWNEETTKKWLPVDTYIGGAEHSVLHLLYARFITMVFHDLRLLDFEEPFTKFRAHGLLIREGAKMSKSKGNVVVPDEYIKTFGADTLRTYLMFLGPFDQGGDFQDKGIAGITRFLKRVWTLVHEAKDQDSERGKESDEIRRKLHETVKKVTSDLENLKYNTAIAAMMEFINFWEANKSKIGPEVSKTFLQLLAPFAPHMTEELWVEVLDEKFSIHTSDWPLFDERVIEQVVVVVPVMINGKVRDTIEVSSTAKEEEVLSLALSRPKVQQWVNEAPKRTVYVAGRILNIVI